jgi:non-specific serine/threonine protein kinase
VAGVLAGLLRNYDRGTELLHEALAYWRAIGDRREVAQTLSRLGSLAAVRGRLEDARAFLTEALHLRHELGDQHGIGMALTSLGVVAFYSGDHLEAECLSRQAIDTLRPLGERDAASRAALTLAMLAHERGEYDTALELLHRSLAVFHELGDRGEIAETLELIAGILAVVGQTDRAARLFGAAAGLVDAIGWVAPLATSRYRYREHVGLVRARLGEPAFSSVWKAGQALSVEDAIALAMSSVLPPPPSRRGTPSTSGTVPLTRREQEVVALVAAGRTNREIAQALVISERTAESHVSNALAKVGVSSRAQLAVWATEHRLNH